MSNDSVPTAEIETINDFLVGISAGDIVFPLGMPLRRIPKAQALRLAAWIVAMVDISDDNAEFLAVLKAVQNT